MKQISINDLPRLRKKLNEYKLTYNQNGIVKFIKDDDELIFKLNDYISKSYDLFMPNYDNCILNIDASISSNFGVKSKYKSSEVLDKILQDGKYKHIALMLLDGMGSYILRKNLDDESFLSNHKICDMSAVFPPTTACAIPALCSGLEPLKTGWVGWQNYFKEINEYVVMFRNVEYFTGKPLDINIEKDVLPYEKFYSKFPTYIFELGVNLFILLIKHSVNSGVLKCMIHRFSGFSIT